MTDANVYLLYAVLAGLSGYVALLAIFGRRFLLSNWALAGSWLFLTIAFACLALGRTPILGIKHGTLAVYTRAAFIGYGLSLCAIIYRYWLRSWQARHPSNKKTPG